LSAHLELGLDLSWDGYLGGGHSALWICGLVVHKPEIGIDVSRACGDSIAMARVHGIWFVGVVVATVVDEDLESL